MPNFVWLIEGCLAGVLRPRTDDALATLYSVGERVLLTLSEEVLSNQALAVRGAQAVHIPIADFAAPTIDQVGRAVATIDHFLQAGRSVAVYCGAGLGRTGTILACYLVAQGTSAAEAIRQIRLQRPMSTEPAEQNGIVLTYEYDRKA